MLDYFHLSYHRVFVSEAPRALITKTKNNQPQGQEATLLRSYILASCLGIDGMGQCLKLKTSTFKPCHIICQLGLGLDSVDGVKAVFLDPTFRLS